jgi:DTW domain-containing protein YfiP
MNKSTYLELKQKREASVVKYSREEFCYTCERIQRNCLCSLITPFYTKIHFVILMHPMEARREKIGTGKLSKLSLLNSQIIVGVNFAEDPRVNSILTDSQFYCLLLYPGKNALNISEGDFTELNLERSNGRRLVIILIDGTWPCAKKMIRLSKNLAQLPRISFSADHKSIFGIKEQPADYCLSTLESIHILIRELNNRGIEDTQNKEDQMINVFKAMIDYQIKCSLDPALSSRANGKMGYSKKEDRVTPKKWLTRNIFLQD